jgi:hypothetical protein
MAVVVAGMIPRLLPDRGGPGLHKKPLYAAIGQVLWPMEAIGHANTGIVNVFHCQNHRKRLLVDAKAPVFNRGIKYQTEGKDLTNMTELFVGVVKKACYCLNN